jgi:hypothetical protein
MKLTGQKNQCAGCGLYFRSNHAFDKHRVGKHGVSSGAEMRRCLSESELNTLGWSTDQNGFYRTPSLPGASWWAKDEIEEKDLVEHD